MPASDYAEQVLFGPLGFGGFEWPANPDGITIGWGELWLHPADMARFGYLYLRDGEWDGAQLVPPAWVETATTEHISADTLASGYGYQWWIADDGYAMALGYGGQYIIVSPEHDLVMVVTSGLPGEQFGLPQELATGYVIPAVISDTPIPPDPDARARLAEAVAAVAEPPGAEPVTLPERQADLAGSRWVFSAPELGDVPFGLRFERDAAYLTLGVNGEPAETAIGLDGRYARADTVPLALRGRWSAEETFAIDFQVVGGVERGTFRLTLADDGAEVVYSETTNGLFGRTTAERVG